MTAYRLHPAVPDDIDSAADWYEQREPGLGVEFVLAVEAALSHIVESPHAWARWPDTPDDLDIRRFTMARFPFVIGYLDDGAGVVILVVDHGKRRPLHWLRRLRSP